MDWEIILDIDCTDCDNYPGVGANAATSKKRSRSSCLTRLLATTAVLLVLAVLVLIGGGAALGVGVYVYYARDLPGPKRDRKSSPAVRDNADLMIAVAKRCYIRYSIRAVGIDALCRWRRFRRK